MLRLLARLLTCWQERWTSVSHAWWQELSLSGSFAPLVRRPRLWLESLEERSVPSVLPVAGASFAHGPTCPCCMSC
ncbi:MAG: hypothetical protein SNJ82_04725, partial [Gemmataceae bacterium]